MSTQNQEPALLLDNWLKELGYSGEHFAQIMGVTPETVSRWRNGRIEVPRYALACLDLLQVMKQMRDKIDSILQQEI